MTGNEHRPGRSREIKRSILAHNVAHGLTAIKNTIHAVREITEKPFGDITAEEWADIVEDVRTLDHEITCQIFDSFNFITHGSGKQRPGSGRQRIKRRLPISLLEEMLPDYKARASARGISITVSNEAETEVRIELNIDMVRQAFHNALTNAVKYSYSGSGRGRFISIRCMSPRGYDGTVAIEFANYGIGIEKDEINAVWEVYRRGRIAEREATQGRGLGLPQIRECMRCHRGRAALTSEPQSAAPNISPAHVPYKTTLRLEFPMETHIGSQYKS